MVEIECSGSPNWTNPPYWHTEELDEPTTAAEAAGFQEVTAAAEGLTISLPEDDEWIPAKYQEDGRSSPTVSSRPPSPTTILDVPDEGHLSFEDFLKFLDSSEHQAALIAVLEEEKAPNQSSPLLSLLQFLGATRKIVKGNRQLQSSLFFSAKRLRRLAIETLEFAKLTESGLVPRVAPAFRGVAHGFNDSANHIYFD